MGYIFDPPELHDIAKRAVGKPMPEVVSQIGDELEARYPNHILKQREWVFNNAGGAMGQMLIFHASLSEYLIIFGTATGTEGCTGRFWAEDHFMMLEGEHWCYGEGDLERHVTRPGEVSILRPGQVKHYRLPDRAFALEYARGAIPAMLPFGFADTFSSTLDFPNLWRTVRIYGTAVIGNLLQGKI
jgi:C-8 sterol isomerase